MSKNVVIVSIDELVGEVASLMLANRVSGLPVTDNGRVVGIVIVSDILRMVAHEWQAEVPALSEFESFLPENVR